MSNNLIMWSLIAGFFLPPLLAVVQQPGWSTAWRSIVMFLASIVVAFGTVYFTDSGALTADRMITTGLVIMVTAISTFKGLWVPTGVAPKIEVATSPAPKSP